MIRNRTLIKNWQKLRQLAFPAPKSHPRFSACESFRNFADTVAEYRRNGGRHDDPRRIYPQENISLYKKLLANTKISADQRDVIGKLLAEEEAKLLNLLGPQEQALDTSLQPEGPA